MSETVQKEVAVLKPVVATKKYLAEFFGTMMLVLVGCGSAVIGRSAIGNLGIGIALAFGITVLVLVYAIGGISGCHINPAISISMLAAGKLGVKDTVFYVISQCLGATVGAALVYLIAIGNPAYSLATVGLWANQFTIYSMASAFVAEALLTFIFLLVIFGSTGEKAPKGFAGIAIGLTLVLIHLVSIPITGTSVNPARSLGPALFVGGTALNQLWLFWAAPIIGGLLAAAVWRAFK